MTKSFSLLLGVFAISFCQLPLRAQQTPKLLPFQGRLTDQNGLAVSNGVRLVQFKIYDVTTGGNPVWAGELHRTTVNGGLVNVMLGTKTSLTFDFDRQLYLEITVDVSGPGGTNDNAITLADPPMLPRQAILPVVFAKEAADSRKLAGYDWVPIFGTNNPSIPLPASKLADGSLPGSKIQASSITSNQLAPQTVTLAQIASATITSNQIAPGTISRANLDASLILDSIIPPGTIQAFGGANIPSGWLLCDGTNISRTTYARLFAAIGTAWGAADGSVNFTVPDLRGVFLRGVNGSRNDAFADPNPNSPQRNNLFTGGNSGNQVGSFQSDAFKVHQHFNPRVNAGVSDTGNPPGGYAGLAGLLDTTTSLTTALSVPAGANETRSKNAYVNYIIKH